ncbi:uncharacterized protein LOC126611404 isoform X2 [Malus sylvestris]|uniref:uncharacterized protein LOC126611404 isoform X2 n=1 Tax=Malus sylvestris TaxID=3752 RepID=UPI0021AD2991|nr:uncharacterized protein LOC126611404 isoform X2 [Malus sylvestris]
MVPGKSPLFSDQGFGDKNYSGNSNPVFWREIRRFSSRFQANSGHGRGNQRCDYYRRLRLFQNKRNNGKLRNYHKSYMMHRF